MVVVVKIGCGGSDPTRDAMSTRGGRGHGGNWGLGFSTAGFGRTGANWRVNEATSSQVSECPTLLGTGGSLTV